MEDYLNTLSAFYLCLIARMMGGPTVHLPSKMLKSSKKAIAEWVVQRNKHIWTNRMKYDGLEVSCTILPRMMLLSPLLRTCQIGSLSGMKPIERIVVRPKLMKSLRNLFRRYYETNLGFAVEISTNTHFVIVLIFRLNHNDGSMSLTIEVFNRFQGLVDRTDSNVYLTDCTNTITLCYVSMETYKKECARFFYTMGVNIPGWKQLFLDQVVFYTLPPSYISTSSSKRRKCIA